MNKKLIILLAASILILIGAIILKSQESEPVVIPDENYEVDTDLEEELDVETQIVSIYFLEVVDGQEQIVEVSREIDSTLSIARETINELLKGPSLQEEADGISTSIPEGTELLGINIENGIAFVDFSQELQEGVAGSAWVTSIRDQIENTLLQFETIDQVIILVEGESEEVLQP